MTSARARGFTLIELAVVIAIIGLLVAGAFTSFGAIRTNAKLRETHQAVETVEQLLLGFLMRHGRLPCPADPTLNVGHPGYGREHNRDGSFGAENGGAGCHDSRNTNPGNSDIASYRGTLPAVDLNRGVSALTDGWQTQFHYLVLRNVAGIALLDWRPPVRNVHWALQDDSRETEIELWDKGETDTASPAPRRLVDMGVAAIVSAGPNRHGGYSIYGTLLAAPPADAHAEIENIDEDNYLAAATYSDRADAPFDDIVRVWTEDDLILPLARIGALDTKQALVRKRMQRLFDLIVGFAAIDPERRIPASVEDATLGEYLPVADFGLPTEDGFDAWFNYIQYEPTPEVVSDGLSIDDDMASEDVVFTIQSFGPDREADTGDDHVISVTKAQMLGILARAGVPIDDSGSTPPPVAP